MKRSLRMYGCLLIFSGTLLFGIMHLAMALYIPHLGGWSDPPGKFTIVLNDIFGWVPYVLSILMMFIGAVILINDLSRISKRE